MGRKAKLSVADVSEIRFLTGATQRELAVRYRVSRPTIIDVQQCRGAYRNRVLDLGTPVLDAHGNTVGVEPL